MVNFNNMVELAKEPGKFTAEEIAAIQSYALQPQAHHGYFYFPHPVMKKFDDELTLNDFSEAERRLQQRDTDNYSRDLVCVSRKLAPDWWERTWGPENLNPYQSLMTDKENYKHFKSAFNKIKEGGYQRASKRRNTKRRNTRRIIKIRRNTRRRI